MDSGKKPSIVHAKTGEVLSASVLCRRCSFANHEHQMGRCVMWWECSECGVCLQAPRTPSSCAECGRAALLSQPRT
jgi:hypothetical protein